MPQAFLLVIVYLSFISIGLPDALLGVAWPAIRLEMHQPLAAVGILTITMTACSATSSLLAGRIVERIGTGKVVAGSCLLTSLALFGFSLSPSFGWLVAMVVPLGLGAGAVDASLNHFVAAHCASRHMNWLHGFWGIGATAGPAVMGVALASPAGWTGGAQAIGTAQLVLATVLWATLPLWARHRSSVNANTDSDAASVAAASGNTSLASEPTSTEAPAPDKPLSRSAIWWAPACFLFYVAAEMGTGLWAASILVSEREIGLGEAGFWVSVYFGSITAGRFGSGLIADRLGNRKMIRLGIWVAMAGAALFALPGMPPPLSLAGLVLLGLGCAPIFPSMMHETAKRFPKDLVLKVIGRQMVFASVGGSVAPAAFGLLAAWIGLSMIMPMVLCMLGLLLLATQRLNQLT